MRKTVMIVDGYNVIHRVPVLRERLPDGLEAARRGLIQYCTEWMTRRRDVYLFFVVFDGDTSVHGSDIGGAPGVRMIFTRSGESADDRILQLVQERESISRCVVVSDDLYVTRGSKGQATETEIMTANQFLAVLRETIPDDNSAGGRPSATGDDKGVLTPAQTKAINDELKRAWGLK